VMTDLRVAMLKELRRQGQIVLPVAVAATPATPMLAQ